MRRAVAPGVLVGMAAIVAGIVLAVIAREERPSARPDLDAAPLARIAAAAGSSELAAACPIDDGERRAEVAGGASPAPHAHERATGPRGLTVRVVASDGQPVRGATVVALPHAPRPDAPYEPVLERLGVPGLLVTDSAPSAVTDDDGVAALDRPETRLLGVLAIAATLPPGFVRADPDAERIEIELPRSGAVEGRVLVDGRPPAAPLAVVARSLERRAELWGPTVVAALERRGRHPDRVELLTDAEGHFRWAGFTSDAVIELRVAGPYRTRAGDEPRVSTRADALPITIDVVPVASLPIRTIAASHFDRGAAIDLIVRFRRVGGDSIEATRRCGVGDTVAFDVPSGFHVAADVSARDRDGRTVGRFHVDPAALAAGVGVDLVLPAPERPVVLHVTDPEGRPIEGAFCRYDGRVVDAPLGVVRLDLAPYRGALLIGAPGRRSVRLPFPDIVDGCAVRLAPANRIEVEVRALDPLHELGVGIDVIGGWDGHHPGACLRGAPARDLDGDGVWSASDLPPDRRLTLALRDAHGYVMRREDVTLDADDVVRLVWDVGLRPTTLAGVVCDERHRPIPHAELFVGKQGRPPRRGTARTGLDGAYQVENVFDPRPTLRIEAPGFVPRVVEGSAAIEAAYRPLAPSRHLTIAFADDVAPDRGHDVVLDVGGEVFAARSLGGGRYRVDDAPRLDGEVACRCCATRAPVDATSEDVDLRPR